MNREAAKEAFKKYTNEYDTSDIKIKLKILHTYRVADISDKISTSIGLSPVDVDFAWLLGILHDIGRMEQLTQYGTFKDADSIDHANLGADILFKNNPRLIEQFPKDEKWESNWMEIAETAVRLHNKLKLPCDLDDRTRLFCEIIRSADKIDIMRVLTEPPYDERNNRIVKGSYDGTIQPARDEIMEYVYHNRCIPRTLDLSEFESLISQLCMAFELDFIVAWDIMKERGYLSKLLDIKVQGKMKDQLEIVREQLIKKWEN